MIENLSENSNELFKDYLAETLKRFLDKEIIVQEAACTAFTTMIQTKKEKMEPYLMDIFKIITSVFDIYQGTILLTLYDIISLLTEHFKDHFKNNVLVEDIVRCVVKKWYSILNTEDYRNISPAFDIVCSLLKVTNMMTEFLNDFLTGSLKLIENNINSYDNTKDLSVIDREIVSKCMDLLSVICQTNASVFTQHQSKILIVEYTYKIIEIGDYYVKHYAIALLGDICTIEPELIKPRITLTMEVLISNLELPISKLDTLEVEKLSVCNNSCWTIGLIANALPDEVKNYVKLVMKSLLKILSYTKVILNNVR
jgi:hypothetical protein